MAPDSKKGGNEVRGGGEVEAGGKRSAGDDRDVESGYGGGASQLYPGMVEDPKLRWSFLRKVYALLCLQLLITSGLACTMFFVHPIKALMRSFPGGLITTISVVIVALIFCVLMVHFRKKHPWNLVFMGLFTLAMGSTVGLVCALERGVAVLEAAALTALVTVALTLYTFWAARRGQDFRFLWPFLFSALWVLIGFAVIRIVFPMGRWAELIAGCVGALLFSAFIIYDTDNLIKRYDYDDYTQAACALYLDILNLFLATVQVMKTS